MRLDFLRQLVAEEQRPAALECEPGGAVRLRLRLRCAALGEPPVLERGEEARALRHEPLGTQASVGAEP